MSDDVVYEYDEATLNDKNADELKLSGVKYDASTLSTLEITANTIGTGKRHGDMIQQSELTVKATYANGTINADFKDYTIVYNGGSDTALKKGYNTITVKSGTVESGSINVNGVGGQILTAADFDIKNPNVVTYDPASASAAAIYGALTNGAVTRKGDDPSAPAFLHYMMFKVVDSTGTAVTLGSPMKAGEYTRHALRRTHLLSLVKFCPRTSAGRSLLLARRQSITAARRMWSSLP